MSWSSIDPEHDTVDLLLQGAPPWYWQSHLYTVILHQLTFQMHLYIDVEFILTLATRGVLSWHDLCSQVLLRALVDVGEGGGVNTPQFDRGRDSN